MRILVVTQYFWPESFCVNDLAAGLQQRGHEVTVLTGIPNYPSGRFAPGYGLFSGRDQYRGVRVIRVPLIPRGNSGSLRLAANYLSFAVSASMLGAVRCRQKYDAILVFAPSPATVGIPAVLLKHICRTPVYLWIQDLWPESLAAVGAVRSPWVLRQVERGMHWMYRRCERVLVQSPAFARTLIQRGLPAEKVDYLPNWADPRFQPLEPKSDWPEVAKLPTGFRIVYAGNVGVSQSFETILNAAERCRAHPHLQWIILGDGRRRDWVAREITARQLSSTVHLLDRCSPEQASRFLAAADASLLTLRRADAFAMTLPSKLQNYLACGRPILAAVDGEAAAIVEQSGAGLVGPAEDAECLARNALELSRAEPAVRQAMGQRGHQYCRQHFDQATIFGRLESLIAQTPARGRCAA